MPRSVTSSRDSFYSEDDDGDEDGGVELDNSELGSYKSKNTSSKSSSNSRSSNYTPPKRPSSRQFDSRSSQVKGNENRWVDIKTKNSLPPSDYTVTHVNQTYDYLRLGEMNTAFHMNQNSTEWLKTHGIEFLKLTLKDLLQQGQVTKPISDKTGKAVQHITFDATMVTEFEYKLNLSLEMYSKRIKWLMQSSRKAFGLIEGDRTAIIVDSSTANLGFGRSVELLDQLTNLVNEQLCHKKQFYLASFGTDINELWDINLKDVHHRTLEEAKVFISRMRQSGGCNLLQALKRVLRVKGFDSVVIILGSVPDQKMEIILDFAYQAIINKNFKFHCVAYELTNHIVNTALKKLVDETNGRFHCYSSSQEYLIYNSSDIQSILKEIHRVQDILVRIKEMRKGQLGSAIIRIENEIQMEVEKYPASKFLPRPRGHDSPLKFDTPPMQIRTSAEWLKEFGLKAKKLNLYQILAPNAYSPVEDFIPILKKTVQSTVHERVMAQFTWHDGSVKNLHVDFATLFEYQKQLGSVVKLYEKRIDWLASGSRKIFGAINEDTVVLLVDLSAPNSKYLIHIQHSLRLLMEQQILHKKFFNIISFGRTINRWKPTVVQPTEKNLQDAWKWILDFQCDGTRNTLGALKAALENEEERKHKIDIDGIYIFTSGIPDQPINICCAYIEEASCGKHLKVNTILFNVDDYDGNGAIPGRWANITKTAEALRSLAHCVNNGRFHWFRETGIIENDDIKMIKDETEKALFFSKKAADLVDSFHRRRRGNEMCDKELDAIECGPARPAITSGRPTSAPRQTAIQKLQSKERENDQSTVKALPWRPHTTFESASAQDLSTKRRENTELSQAALAATNARRTIKRAKSAKTFQSQSFYIDGKSNSKGAVFKQYPTKKSVRKEIPLAAIPDREEIITSKDWLRKYSLVKLKLDLHKLVSGPDCKHDTVMVGTLRKDVSARYCSIFPSINLNGVVRHLQLRQGELKEYAEQCEKIVKRYVKRLQWLLTGSRRAFGTVTHDKIAVLIDTSGSMDDHLLELKRELAFLIWEQLCKQKTFFNIIRFSNGCSKWRENIIQATEENCHKAIAWLASTSAYGNTCTLDALRVAFEDKEINGVYLITDGKPDTSTTFVLEEVRKLNQNRRLSINVISFNCEERSANDFLKQLAKENYGRYHKPCKTDRDIHLYAQKILTEGATDNFLSHVLHDFESDDLKLLAGEIRKAKEFLNQSITFSNLYDKRDEVAEEVFIGPIRLNSDRDCQVRHKDCTIDFMR